MYEDESSVLPDPEPEPDISMDEVVDVEGLEERRLEEAVVLVLEEEEKGLEEDEGSGLEMSVLI